MNPKKKSRRYRASVSIQALDLAISRFIHSLGDSVVDQPASTLWHCLFRQFPEAKVHVTV